MSAFITSLQTGLGADELWTAVGSVAPYIVVVALFAFGYRLIRKVTKGASKGKINF